MKLNDILLVTRNYQGICEENFLSTIDEFVEEYCSSNSLSWKNVDGLRKIIAGAEPYKFETYYAWCNDSYDLRLCQGEEDLLKFLSGAYNDTKEIIENRFPGSAGSVDFWYWENRVEKFSELAIEAVTEYARTAKPEFAETLLQTTPALLEKLSDVDSAPIRLEDLIKQAEAIKASNLPREDVSRGFEL